MAGSGTLTQTGGTNEISGGPGLTIGNLVGTSGTYNLEGGLLLVPSLKAGPGNTALNFSGGTLQAGGPFSCYVPIALGTSGGGATFNTAGYDATLVAPLFGPGGLTEIGSGTLTLGSSNSYTGTTFIIGGILGLASSSALAGGGNITFGGGTLQYSVANNSDYSTVIVNSTAPISIDTNGVNVTFASDLASSNTGGLTKIGSGTLTLAAGNNYTGTTDIIGGVLSLANSAALPAGGNIAFGGGTLQYTNRNTRDYSSAINGSTGPVAIDTNGVNITFASSLAGSNSGGLTK